MSALVGDDCKALISGRFIPEERALRCPLIGKMGGRRESLYIVAKRQLLVPPKNRSHFVQLRALYLCNVAYKN